MNKEFKELAEEAGLIFAKDSYGNFVCFPDTPRQSIPTLQKYSDLILQDVFRIIDTIAVMKNDSRAHLYVDALREHFDLS